MTPDQRKTASETLLHKRGIRLNLQLPEIETNDEVRLRSVDELAQRMIALWAVSGAASQRDHMRFRAYVRQHNIEHWLSVQERNFLLHDAPGEEDFIRFSAKRECLFFLAWCGGLVKKIDIPSNESKLDTILHLLPQGLEQSATLPSALQVRSKDAIMDWADLLYRLHWAVRHAALIGKPTPANLHGSVVREWHQAVNWMIGYEDEDNWDLVATDT